MLCYERIFVDYRRIPVVYQRKRLGYRRIFGFYERFSVVYQRFNKNGDIQLQWMSLSNQVCGFGDLYNAFLCAIGGFVSTIGGSLSSIGAKDVATGAFLSSIGGFTKMGTSSFSGCPYQIRFLVLAIYILLCYVLSAVLSIPVFSL